MIIINVLRYIPCIAVVRVKDPQKDVWKNTESTRRVPEYYLCSSLMIPSRSAFAVVNEMSEGRGVISKR